MPCFAARAFRLGVARTTARATSSGLPVENSRGSAERAYWEVQAGTRDHRRRWTEKDIDGEPRPRPLQGACRGRIVEMTRVRRASDRQPSDEVAGPPSGVE